MKLDSRIIDGKKPLTCFDTEEARKFEGKEGYFSDYPRAFADGEASIDECAEKGILTLEGYHENCPYVNKTTRLNYPYFLPAEWLKPEEPEKKYRAFTNEEFLNLFDSGKLHSIRKKNEKGRYIITDVYFNDECVKGAIFVKLNSGCGGFGMEFLVNNGYEYFDGKGWQPFGVEDVSE